MNIVAIVSPLSMPLVRTSLLSMLSGILLALPLLNPAWFVFGWIALIPLLFAIQGKTLKQVYVQGALSGLVFYSSITYWIADYIHLFKGWDYSKSSLWGLLFWLYCSQLIALLSVMFSWLRRTTAISDIILFPVICVLVFAYFPMLFSVQLGEGQSRFLTAIQGTDLVGVHGLDGIMALANICLFRCIKDRKLYIGPAVGFGVVCSWFIYGVFALDYWQQETAGWHTMPVGFIQPNELPDRHRIPVYQGYSRAYPPELEYTSRLAEGGAQWVFWPEARYKGSMDELAILSGYQREIAQAGVNLVYQDIEHVSFQGSKISRNKAVHIDSTGKQFNTHQKNKLVAFGEYTPFIDEVPWIAAVFKAFFGSFTQEIERGKEHHSFMAAGFQVVPLICNETMYPQFVAHAVGATPRHLLVGLSSNGWFGKTLQPYQHAFTSSLRAVENRLGFLHILNNGPSLAVNATGEIITQSPYGEAGGYLIDMPYPVEGNNSFYSRHPDLFMSVMLLLGIGSMVLAGVNFVRSRFTYQTKPSNRFDGFKAVG